MKARGISVFLMVILAACLSSCAVADKAATSWLSRNGAAQGVSSAPALDQESESSAHRKFIAADKHKEMKLIASKKPLSGRPVAKAKGEPVQEETPAESSDSGGGGLIEWYKRKVDSSPLNPLRMMGSGGRLPQPVEDAMRMQGMIKDEPNQEVESAPAESNKPERSGLSGWYMDAVDNSSLNPAKMRKPK